MSDEIKLPPLPSLPLWLVPSLGPILEEYGRASVGQDRARREKQGPHEGWIFLRENGLMFTGKHPDAQHNVLIRWTPERVWIESERNRELARKLRQYVHSKPCQEAADALDGGER